jgi:hypothetical protein
MTTVLSGLLQFVVSLIPIFVGLLYYIGRRFTESYYETLGVPHEALDFSVADYLFKSMQSWMFLIAVALTYLLFILWQSLFRKSESGLEIPSQVARKEEKSNIFTSVYRLLVRAFKPRKGDPQFLGLFYFFYAIFGVALLIILILPAAEPNFPAEAVAEIGILAFAIVLAWLVMKDKPTINFIRARKRLMQLFIASAVFTIVVSMQLLPHGIGRFAGIIQANPGRIEQVFPSVTLFSNEALWSEDIDWIERDGIYESTDRLVLILQNNGGVFVKEVIEEETSEIFKVRRVSETYYMPNTNVQGLTINIPGKFPKNEEK